jgi:hypothetical protein
MALPMSNGSPLCSEEYPSVELNGVRMISHINHQKLFFRLLAFEITIPELSCLFVRFILIVIYSSDMLYNRWMHATY